MIAIIGSLGDDVAATICALLAARHADFSLLAPAGPVDFALQDGIPSGRLRGHAGCERDWREVTAVLLRGMSAPDRRDADAWQTRAALDLLADHHPALVINRPAASISNLSKPYQLSLIAAAGFSVPPTVLTNDPDEARAFITQCSGRAIFKSASDQRSIVRRVGPDDLDRLELVACCPTQFQEFIPGIDLRVHVIGQRAFASEVLTDAIDYRFAGREGLPREIRGVTLETEVEQRCVALAEALDLSVAGIDLRRTPHGEWVCFEVNPAPAFTFYQAHTGQAIGDAVCDLLLGGSHA